MDLLPLLFTTALVAYLLSLGSADLARSIIRIFALLCVSACLLGWGLATLEYDDWGRPFIDDFYATDLVQRRLGQGLGGLTLVLGGVLPIVVALYEMWRIKIRRSAPRPRSL